MSLQLWEALRAFKFVFSKVTKPQGASAWLQPSFISINVGFFELSPGSLWFSFNNFNRRETVLHLFESLSIQSWLRFVVLGWAQEVGALDWVPELATDRAWFKVGTDVSRVCGSILWFIIDTLELIKFKLFCNFASVRLILEASSKVLGLGVKQWEGLLACGSQFSRIMVNFSGLCTR